MQRTMILGLLAGCIPPPPACPWEVSVAAGATSVDPFEAIVLRAGQPLAFDELGFTPRFSWTDTTRGRPVDFVARTDLDAGEITLVAESRLPGEHEFLIEGPDEGPTSTLRVDRLPFLAPVAVPFSTSTTPRPVAAFEAGDGVPSAVVLVVLSEPVRVPDDPSVVRSVADEPAVAVAPTRFPTVWEVTFDVPVDGVQVRSGFEAESGAPTQGATLDVVAHPSRSRDFDREDLQPYVAEGTCSAR